MCRWSECRKKFTFVSVCLVERLADRRGLASACSPPRGFSGFSEELCLRRPPGLFCSRVSLCSDLHPIMVNHVTRQPDYTPEELVYLTIYNLSVCRLLLAIRLPRTLTLVLLDNVLPLHRPRSHDLPLRRLQRHQSTALLLLRPTLPQSSSNLDTGDGNWTHVDEMLTFGNASCLEESYISKGTARGLVGYGEQWPVGKSLSPRSSHTSAAASRLFSSVDAQTVVVVYYALNMGLAFSGGALREVRIAGARGGTDVAIWVPFLLQLWDTRTIKLITVRASVLRTCRSCVVALLLGGSALTPFISDLRSSGWRARNLV